MSLQVINEVVWLHLICCSPIPSVCLVCPSDAPQGFVWQSSLKSIHTHCLETLHLCIANSTPHHVQHHPLRSVYFAPDLSLHKDDMEPHNRSQTDVWANVDHVLRQLWGQLWDYRCTLAPASVAIAASTVPCIGHGIVAVHVSSCCTRQVRPLTVDTVRSPRVMNLLLPVLMKSRSAQR